MINQLKQDAQARMAKSIDALRHNLVKVRTGRASTGLVDTIKVSAYGSDVPLSQVAAVSVSDARSLVINPWDKAMVGAIEKAILASDLGLTPNTAGTTIRLNLPALTEERRRELTKVVHGEGEDTKVAIRNIRRDANQHVQGPAQGQAGDRGRSAPRRGRHPEDHRQGDQGRGRSGQGQGTGTDGGLSGLIAPYRA